MSSWRARFFFRRACRFLQMHYTRRFRFGYLWAVLYVGVNCMEKAFKLVKTPPSSHMREMDARNECQPFLQWTNLTERLLWSWLVKWDLTKSISYASLDIGLLNVWYHVLEILISKNNQSNAPQCTHSNLEDEIQDIKGCSELASDLIIKTTRTTWWGKSCVYSC